MRRQWPQYKSISEVLREGVRLVEERIAEHNRKIAVLQAAIDESEAAAARGQYSIYTPTLPEELDAAVGLD